MYTKLQSFDRTEEINSHFERPDRYRELFKIIASSKNSIARGAGLSYCNAGAGEGSVSISTLLFNRVLEFDDKNGFITVEPGLRLGDFVALIAKKNWSFPVIPGYPSITIGGCVAFNVHGKTQHNVGNFGNYIISLSIFHPKYGEVDCNQRKNLELFELTIGGFGLTGFITKIKLKLEPLKGNVVNLKKVIVPNLLDAVKIMRDISTETDVLYSWHNLNKKKLNFGKGIIYSEKIVQEETTIPSFLFKTNKLQYSNLFKLNIMNNFFTKMECNIFSLKEKVSKKNKKINYIEASFPIYGKEIYYKLFGKRGFREYQMIIPYSNWEPFVDSLEYVIKKINISISLASLKLFNGKTKYLNFCKNGVCLAIDVPAGNNALLFFSKLDDLLIKNNGIINLSKDSRIKSSVLINLFPEYELFKSKLYKFDAKKIINSSLRKRINV